jgi:hypothetical protein
MTSPQAFDVLHSNQRSVSVRTIPATLNSIGQEAIQKFVREWRYRHGELQQCVAHWEVHEDGKVRWFPTKVIDLYFTNAHGQIRLDTETGKVTVAINPDNKPKLAADAPPVPVAPMQASPATYLGMQPLEEAA